MDKDKKKDLFLLGDPDDPVGNPLFDQSAEIGVLKHVAFTVDLDGPNRKVREAVRDNNYGGFYFYILDRANPTPPIPAEARVPLPVDESVLDPDAQCDPAPDLFITHHFEFAGISYFDNFEVPLGAKVTINMDVFNRGQDDIDGVRACSSLLGECLDLGTIPAQTYAPRESQLKQLPRKAGQLYSRVSASSANGGTRDGNPILIVVGCEPFLIVEPSPSPNPGGDSKVSVGGTSVRHFRVVDKVEPAAAEAGGDGRGRADRSRPDSGIPADLHDR